MKHNCPMCGEQWNEDVCQSCGWFEGKQPRYQGRAMDAIADTVLKYRPKAKSKPAVQRKRRKTILEKKHAKGR
jgi:uncharacterized membrane protein YvbJ